MVFAAHVLTVLIAAPSDTSNECRAVESSLSEWNAARARREQIILLPWRYTSHAVPVLGGNPQSIINSQAVDRADIVIALFDSRLGQATEHALSGTVKEIERARAAGKPVHVYFSREDIPRNADLDQLGALKAFRTRLQQEGLVGEYANPEDVGYQVRQAIEHDITELALTDPAPPPGTAGALLRSRYRYEKTQNGVDGKGKPKFSVTSRLVLRNDGTRTASGVALEVLPVNEQDQFRFDGPNGQFDLLPKAEREWPFLPLRRGRPWYVPTGWRAIDPTTRTRPSVCDLRAAIATSVLGSVLVGEHDVARNPLPGKLGAINCRTRSRSPDDPSV